MMSFVSDELSLRVPEDMHVEVDTWAKDRLGISTPKR